MISVMTEQVADYNKALSRISAILPVRRSTDAKLITHWSELVPALMEVRAGESVMFTPVSTEPSSGKLLIRDKTESINYSPKE